MGMMKGDQSFKRAQYFILKSSCFRLTGSDRLTSNAHNVFKFKITNNLKHIHTLQLIILVLIANLSISIIT